MTASHAYSGDQNAANNSLSRTLDVAASTTISSFPYIQNFDAFTTCANTNNCGGTTCTLTGNWINPTNGSIDDIDWRTYSGSTPSSGTGPSSDVSGSGKYLYLETSQGTPCIGQEAVLFSPCFDLSGLSNPLLKFYSHLYGGTMGTLQVDLIVDGVYIEEALPAFTRNENTWIQHVLDLNPYSGSVVTIVFKAITGSNWQSDIAIDVVSIESPAPVAAFTDNGPTSFNEILELTDQTTNMPNQWSWTVSPATYQFVQGTSSTSQNPRIEFLAANSYTVTLTASNGQGSDQTSKVFGIAAVSYADKKWDNEGGTNEWGDGLNWDPDGIPSSIEDAVFDHTHIAGSYSLNASLETEIRELSVGTNIALTIQALGTIHAKSGVQNEGTIQIENGGQLKDQ